MKAILIDPFTRTIKEVEYSGNYQDIYGLIDCEIFTCVEINQNQDGIFVDDEGLFKPDQAFFKHDGYPQPLSGRGLVLGCDEEGDSVEPTVTLEETKAAVQWVNVSDLVDPEIIVMRM